MQSKVQFIVHIILFIIKQQANQKFIAINMGWYGGQEGAARSRWHEHLTTTAVGRWLFLHLKIYLISAY